MPRNQQGLAASLVNTVVNYSISIGLGMAGLVDSRLDRGGRDMLRGFRSAWYLGIGLGSLGMAVSTYFIITGVSKSHRKKRALHDDLVREDNVDDEKDDKEMA